MKTLLTLLIAALLMIANPTWLQSPEPVITPTSPEEFDADGYDGAWATVTALDVEIFLPEGWIGEDVGADDVCYRAESADGDAALEILYPLENAPAGEVVSAGGKEARLTRGDDLSLTVTLALSGGRVAGFRFVRASEAVLSEELALQIAGSCIDVW